MSCLGCEKAGGLRPCVCEYGWHPLYLSIRATTDMKQDEIKVIEDKATGKKYKQIVMVDDKFTFMKVDQGDILIRPLKEKPMPKVEYGDLVILNDGYKYYVFEDEDLTWFERNQDEMKRHFRNGKLIWSKGDE